MKRVSSLRAAGASNRIDGIGFGASMLCAVHCAVLPIAASLLPAIGGSVLATPLVELGMIALGFVLATMSLTAGYRRHHHRPWALLTAAAGFAAITAGHTLVPESLEPWFTATGAFSVAMAHVINARLCRRCCTPPAPRSTLTMVGFGISAEPGS